MNDTIIKNYRFVFEQLDVGSVATAQLLHFFDLGAWMHVEKIGHPGAIVVLEWPVGIERFEAQHIDEEVVGLIEVRHRDADMFGAAQAW